VRKSRERWGLGGNFVDRMEKVVPRIAEM